MDKSNDAVKALLGAEQDASKIVGDARKYRTDKLKKARAEAQSEIDEYKKSKDDEYKQGQEKYNSRNAEAEKASQKDTDKKIAEIRKVGEQKSDQVIADLLKAVMDVHPEPPQNAV